MNDRRTLGVFDSGIGGLTVVRHLRRLLPGVPIVYFGDTARVPYGAKSDATVRRFAGEAVRFLTQFRVGRVVVACNTVSAVALRALGREFQGLPIDGVIEPGADAAVQATRSGRIGVIGTRATVGSAAYERAVSAAARRAGKRARVHAVACPLLVPLAEEGLEQSKAARELLRDYLAPLQRRKIDTLILGCTHYPPFRRALGAVLGPRVRLIDSGEATARRLAKTMRRERSRGRGSLRCYVSDIPRQFERIGRRFLGHSMGRVRLVPQDDHPWFERPPLREGAEVARARVAPKGKEGRRVDGRRPTDLRPITIRRGYLKNAEGSALIEMGGTRVICAATVEDRVPPFLRNTGRGWVTAEYSMLPRSSHERIQREVTRGHVGGRTHEIQRLIGRSLRAVTNLEALGERQILVDCDVLEADGGTRTASITGAFVALVDAIRWLTRRVELPGAPLRDFIAAVSVGIVGEEPMLDLCYEEDSKAEVDMNLVLTGSGRLVEIQGTAEGKPFSERELATMMELGKAGIRKLIAQQKRTLGLRTLPKTWT